MKRWPFVVLFCLISFSGIAQVAGQTPWFLTANIGEQHSGIRKENYVVSNFSPLIAVEGGKFFTSFFALRLVAKGVYYNFISDEDKHFYGFLYGDVVIDLQNIFAYREDRIWNTQLFIGGGVMYNRYPYVSSQLGMLEYENGRIMPAIDIGISNIFRISRQVQLGIDIAGICGWGLYQNDEDMIPSASLKVVHSFR